MVNARLRPGSAHSLAPGTKDFIFQSLQYGKSMVQDPLLLVMDSGFDSQDVILDLISADRVDFFVKHNLRQESKEEWLENAKNILKTYRDRGTSEQYHAEFKDEMDMERLPSGKFKVNSTSLLLGMLVYHAMA